MLLWEFLGMGPLSQTVLESPVMGAFFSSLPGFLLDWNTAILAPPTEDNGKHIGFFYHAAWADPAESEL